MKLTVLLLFVALFSAQAEGTAQSVTISGKDLSFKQVFSAVKKQTGYVVFGNEELFSSRKTFSLSVNQLPLRSLLDLVLKDLPFDYDISGKTVFISRKAARPPVATTHPFGGIYQLYAPPVRIRIVDEEGLPLTGATVAIKNSKVSGVTDPEGNLQLSLNAGAVLEVSFVGFEKQTITYKQGATLTITLKRSVTNMTEAVVNGIYRRPAENYTGSAQSYSVEQLRTVNNTNVLSAIRSLDASFQMPSDINFGSDPNRLPQLQVRGANSIANTDLTSQYGYVSNPPLLILDGFEVPLQKIYDLDMNRIKKVTILKDAAATSIYGSKAANGVLVIETLQPKKGKLRFSYNNNILLTTPDLSSYHLLNAAEKLMVEKAAGVYNTNPQNGISAQTEYDQLYSLRLAEVRRGVNTYWLSQPLNTTVGQKHSVYLDGGDDYMRYGVDLSFNNNPGIMKGSKRDNLSGGINLQYHKGSLQFTNYLSISYNNAVNSPYGSFAQFAALNPYLRTVDSISGKTPKLLQDNSGLPNLTSNVFNPMYNATLKTHNSTSYVNITENFQADWNIRPALRLSTRFSMYTQQNTGKVFLPADAVEFVNTPDSLFSTRGYFEQMNGMNNSYQGDVFLNYGQAFGKHTVYSTAGYHIQQDKANGTTHTVQGFPNAEMDDILFGLQYPVNSKPSGTESYIRQMSYYANLSYAYDVRYLLDISFRRDGSSLYGSNKYYAPFWSVGAGWNLHQEKGFHLPNVINRLKLRASYGSTGSQNFPPFASSQTYRYLTSFRYLDYIGASIQTLGNKDLKWQQTNKTNAGVDLELFDGRLQATYNYYIERTNNLFTAVNTAPSSGFGTYFANLGKMENRGMEIYLTAFVMKKPQQNVYWSFTANLFYNKNKLLQISDGLKAQNDKAVGEQTKGNNPITAPVLQYKEGQSISTIYAVRSLGIDPSTGNEIFLNRFGQQTYLWDPLDQVPVGDNQPRVNGNLGTNFMYKGFSINVVLRTEFGGQMYNNTLADRVENANPIYNVDSRVLTGRWQKPGDQAAYKGLANIGGNTRTDITKASSRFIQDNNSLYCDAITLGYLLPARLIKPWNMSRLQCFLYINNPFVVSSIRQERGLEYPFARNYALSLQLDF
ncbi:MAG: SusC/RagA family TonB-linked outer membrane protein [Candidatus Pseudobacter hemicellulosilyticus]|uniref:SusC/RagA family TonB-linked outer membrane protein n=1 Tax=Candidatus Pseudobacter hemicellulosilyticus TaxID=3121375 RepID=A0AAJ5WUN8_9BACT|nr:MAG: SusC/RagA family TonB-linked outer membrane protein [Pseudobacter sp.]